MQSMHILRASVLIVFCGACARQTPTPIDSSSRQVAFIADSTWYMPPTGCARDGARPSPAPALMMYSAWSDTSRDSNAREAAFARVVPGGWAGFWLDVDH